MTMKVVELNRAQLADFMEVVGELSHVLSNTEGPVKILVGADFDGVKFKLVSTQPGVSVWTRGIGKEYNV